MPTPDDPQLLVLAPGEPQPDAPTDIAKLPAYWDERRRLQGKPDRSRCAAELRIALASRAAHVLDAEDEAFVAECEQAWQGRTGNRANTLLAILRKHFPEPGPTTMSTFTPTDVELDALEHIFTLAEGHSGGSRRARSLLGSWWNAAELGGFDFADLWSLDAQAVTVVQLICRLPAGTYAHDLPGDFGERMRKLHERMVIAPPPALEREE
jgi:hypothetical protein